MSSPLVDQRVLGLDETSRKRAVFSIRSILLFVAWLTMWQGWHVGGSVFQLNFLTELTSGLLLHETVMFITFVLLILERVFSGDFTLQRSYFAAPITLLAIALFISWARGAYINQHVGIVYEAHESLQIVTSFFILINVFRRPEDRKLLVIFFMFATIMKAADGACVKFLSDDPQVGWGVLLLWRDGFLLALGIICAMLLVHYKGKEWIWLRKVMLWSIPLLFFTLIVSYRRTFFLALMVAAGVMFISVGKGRRGLHLKLMVGLLLGLGVFILFTDPLGFIARLFGILQPQEEGSAYIRLLEYPNILMNIYHNPIFGVPIGTEWFQYYRMPLYANFTTLGCHNTYLYWPLRTGILGTIGFFWLLSRCWKAVLINRRIQKSEEDFVINQMSIHMMVIYNVASFFGLMYSDAMTSMTGAFLTLYQLQIVHASGLKSYANVSFIQTLKQGVIVFKEKDKMLPARIVAALNKKRGPELAASQA